MRPTRRAMPAGVAVAWRRLGIGHHPRFPPPLKTHCGQRGGGEDPRIVLGLEHDGRAVAERGVQAVANVDLVVSCMSRTRFGSNDAIWYRTHSDT
jgi:hypothetical protein